MDYIIVASILVTVLFLYFAFRVLKILKRRGNVDQKNSRPVENRLKALEARMTELEPVAKLSEDIISRINYLYVEEYERRIICTLSAAFIRYEDKVLLVLLRDGEFKDYWGFPAGYVDPHILEQRKNPKLKADHQIKKYFGDKLDLSYVSCLTEVGGPLEKLSEIVYNRVGITLPTRVKLYDYVINDPKCIPSPVSRSDICFISGLEIQKLKHPVNPLVSDVFEIYYKILFSDEFKKRQRQAKLSEFLPGELRKEIINRTLVPFRSNN